MKNIYRVFWVIGFCFFVLISNAQLNVTGGINAADLVDNILGDGVVITNEILDCGDVASGLYDNGSTTNIGTNSGVLLTSGSIFNAPGPNDAGNTSTNFNGPGDADLEALIPNTQDACILEFDFVAEGNFVSFNYVFASEEYDEFFCSAFNDVFAFFVTGPNPAGGTYNNQNIAIIPGTTLPVAINNIGNGECNGVDNSNQFNTNIGGTTIEYDGFTNVFTASIDIQPCQEYHLKLAIADVGDRVLDSGVFIEEGSFIATSIIADVEINDESCPGAEDGSISITLSGGQPPYDIVWSTGATTEDITGLAAGTYTVTVEDNLGCSVTESFEVGSEMATLELICPTGVTYACNNIPGDIFTDAGGSFSGTCGTITTDYTFVHPGPCGGDVSLTVVATNDLDTPLDSSDDITESCVIVVTVEPAPTPTFDTIEDLTISCELAPPTGTILNFSNNETGDCEIMGSETGAIDGSLNDCGGSYTETWTHTDVCGNLISTSRIITVQDTTNPTIVCPADIVLNCPGDTTTTVTGVAEATDQCSTPTVIYSDDIILGDCDGVFDVVRTWTAIDECGNMMSCDQMITVQDTTSPTIMCPADIVLNCPGDTTTVVTGVATTMDECTSASLSYIDAVTAGNCDGAFDVVRTWTAIDECGNTMSCDQMITVQDTTSPTIMCPADIVLNCPGDTTTVVTGVATAMDECTSASLSYSDVVTAGDCDGVFDVVRTWTAIDECGNIMSCDQMITVQDTTSPTIMCPADIVLNCPGDTTTVVTGVATAMDECTSASLSYSDVVILGDCDGVFDVVRTWTAIDECGNMMSCDQMIAVQDTTSPTIVCPADVTLNVPADTTTVNTGIATAMDECTSALVSYSDEVIEGDCEGTYSVVRTWTAIDECNNMMSCEQMIIVQDIAPPMITCPADLTLNCPADTTTTNTGMATGVDENSMVMIDYSDEIIDGICVSTFEVIRTWVAIDSCGNMNSCEQSIMVQDTTSPTIICPADIVLNCPGDTTTVVTGVATAMDECTSASLSYSDVVTAGDCDGVFDVVRTWTAIDECGNMMSCDQMITVQDTTSPTIICPADIVLNCPGDTTTVVTGVATAMDECTSASLSYSDVVIVGDCDGAFGVVRTWTAIDECGNMMSCGQMITVQDTTSPTIICPADVTLNVPADTTTVNTGIATAMDECTSALVSYSDEVIEGDCEGTYSVVRTWTAIDECNNMMSCEQMIIVQDIAPPMITCPADLTLDCPADTTTTNTGIATGVDENGSVSISYDDSITDGTCGQNYSIARTWTTTDSCGNINQCVQSITVMDETMPSIECPFDITLNCSADTSALSTGIPEVMDECSGIFSINYEDEIIPGSCEFNYVINRSWSVADSCGNMNECIQSITVQDTTPPVIICPIDQSAMCNTTGFIAATDISEFIDQGGMISDECCLDSLSFTYEDTQMSAGSDTMVMRKYTISDCCGQTSACTQLLMVMDVTPPVAMCKDTVCFIIEEPFVPIEILLDTIENGSYDNCQIDTMYIDELDIVCDQMGQTNYYNINLYVIDNSGLADTCSSVLKIMCPALYDLALTKKGITMNPGPMDDLSFEITVHNQGTTPIDSVQIIDYLPDGYVLNDPNWTISNLGPNADSPTRIISIENGFIPTGGIPPYGGTVTVPITISPMTENTPGIVINGSEIISAQDLEGKIIEDEDSVYDDDPANDSGGIANGETDDALNGDGTGAIGEDNPTTDEDDQDPGFVCVVTDPKIEGTVYVCPYETQTYSVIEYNPEYTYEWIVAGGEVLSQNEGSVDIKWGGNPGSFLIEVREYTDDQICFGSDFFQVTIEGPVAIACIGFANVSLGEECSYEVTTNFLLTGGIYPDSSYTIVLKDENGNIIDGNILTEEHIGQQIQVMIIHACSGNSCWGYINIEDKLAPTIVCPADTVMSCVAYDDYIIENPDVVYEGCGDNSFLIIEKIISQTCNEPYKYIVEVTYVATDNSGNVSEPCVQLIFVERQEINEVEFPLSYDGQVGNNEPLNCSASFPLDENGHPSPSFTGQPILPVSCGNIIATYNDQTYPICNALCSETSSYAIKRTWTVIDWCTNETITYIQEIKIMDTEAPVIEFIADQIAMASNVDCSVEFELPTIEVSDNCTPIEELDIQFQSSIGLVNGTVVTIPDVSELDDKSFEVELTISDCCGNIASDVFTVDIIDQTAPTAVGHQHIVTSLGQDGTSYLYAENFDDGSFDACGNLNFSVKRVDNGGTCIAVDNFAPNGDDNGQLNEIVHFCCADVGELIMVQFQVCDDNNNCNSVMSQVEVQEKIAPEIICPANTTVSCIESGLLDWDDEQLVNQLFGEATGVTTCSGLVSSQVLTDFNCEDGTGNLGEIVRIFTIDNGFGTASCTQSIQIVGSNDNSLSCDRISFDLSSPIFESLSAEELEAFGSGVNNPWCADDDDLLNIIAVDCNQGFTSPDLIINQMDLCSEVDISIEIDTFYSGGLSCKEYLIHYEVIDACQFDQEYVNPETGLIDPYTNENGYFHLYLKLKAFDQEGPMLVCSDVDLYTITCTGATGSIELEASDNCSDEIYFDYNWKLDIGADGIIDYPQSGYINEKTANPSLVGLSEFPIGDHHIYWIVSDGCGNQSACIQNLKVIKDDTPQPYCIDGISTTVMPNIGEVELWAKDFDNGAQGPCGEEYSFSMVPVQDIEPGTDGYTQAQANWTFDCSYIDNGIVGFVEIRIFATNDLGNYDYCEASLRLDDNSDACQDSDMVMYHAGGIITTESNEFIPAVELMLSSNYPGFPVMHYTDTTGQYAFDDQEGQGMLYEQVDFNIEPQKDYEYLHGVSTLDMIKIQKHILGVDLLDSPYKLIAADVNNDCKVTGTDIVQLRKLLLGYYENDDLPLNTSWRFIESNFDFYQNDPCQFVESIEIDAIDSDQNHDFIGVKIGDVNGSANFNLVSEDVETREDQMVYLELEDVRLAPNEIVEIPIYSKNFQRLFGFQFELNFERGIEIIDIKSDGLNVDNAVRIDSKDQSLSVSYQQEEIINLENNTLLFTMLVRVDDGIVLSENMKINDNRLKNEAYRDNNLDILPLSISYRNSEKVFASDNFSLHQNEPNPFKEQTMVRFELKHNAEAHMSIFDVQGKLLFDHTQNYEAGTNEFLIRKDQVNATGIIYFRIEVEGQSEIMKMIHIK